MLAGSGEREPALKALCREKNCQFTNTAVRHSLKIHPPLACISWDSDRSRRMPSSYALASVFILPSKSEEWGLVVNEAMASGLPVVVSERAGCAEDLLPAIPHPLASQYESEADAQPSAFKMRKNGFVFDPDSSEELSRQLELLIAKPRLRERMAAESRKIVENFSPENFAQQAIVAASHAMAADDKAKKLKMTSMDTNLIELIKIGKRPDPALPIVKFAILGDTSTNFSRWPFAVLPCAGDLLMRSSRRTTIKSICKYLAMVQHYMSLIPSMW